MRHLVPATFLTALVAALAACGPQGAAPATTPGASTAPGASAAPGGGTTTPGGTSGGTTSGGSAAGPVTDLATRFPMPGATRHVVYGWTSVTKATNRKGTDDIKYDKCDTTCVTVFDRTLSDGKLDRNDAKAYPQVAGGVIVPVQDEFADATVDLAEALKKGGFPEEEITVKAGRFKVMKVTHGTSRAWTWYIQKPWVIKAEFSNPGTGASATTELEKLE